MQFHRLLTDLIPTEPARIRLGTSPRNKEFVRRLAGVVERSQLLETLERCEGENLQLSWPSEGQDPVLEVIAELYDDHIELSARAPAAENVEASLAKLEKESA